MTEFDAAFAVDDIHRRILVIRGIRVMLDADLAALYGVETKALVRAMKRNVDRFPDDFMFQLQSDEFRSLRRQFGTSNGQFASVFEAIRQLM